MIFICDLVNVYGLLACVTILFWYYSKSTFNHWKKLNVKYKEPTPFFGNVAKFTLIRQPYFELIHELYAYFANEPYGGFFQMRSPTLLVKDPELITQMLITDFKSFCDRGFEFAYVNKQLNPLSCHLFFAEGDRWRALRQKMSPVFTSGKLKTMYEQIFSCVNMMNDFLASDLQSKGGGEGTEVNLKELFERLTIDVIGSCAFGIECNSLKSNNEFRTKGAAVFKPRFANAVRILVSVLNKKLLYYLNLRDIKKDISDFFLNTVLNTIDYRKVNGLSRKDVLQMLMDLQNTSVNPKYAYHEQQNNILTNEEFDEIDVAANAFLFFIAGFETTATTLSYCLYELALNVQVQDKLRKEVQNMRDKHENIGPDNLKELKYMDAVISETLRKYPVVPTLNREVTEEYLISKFKLRLQPGTKIIIPTWSIHHDCKYYPNPEVFNPERFNTENKSNIISGTYMPFGEGPRYCLGKRFAQMEIKAALADIILKYNFSPCAKTEIPVKYQNGSFLLAATSGPWINLTKRKI